MKLSLTQAQLAQRMRSSQSRVAKIEVGDRTVSIDLLVHAFECLGATRMQLARVIGAAPRIKDPVVRRKWMELWANDSSNT